MLIHVATREHSFIIWAFQRWLRGSFFQETQLRFLMFRSSFFLHPVYRISGIVSLSQWTTTEQSLCWSLQICTSCMGVHPGISKKQGWRSNAAGREGAWGISLLRERLQGRCEFLGIPTPVWVTWAQVRIESPEQTGERLKTKCFVCHVLYVQVNDTSGKRIINNKMIPSNSATGKPGGIFFINDQWGKTHLTMISATTTALVVLGCI